MNQKHPFFWLANGYMFAGILGGLGIGIMSGHHVHRLMPSDPLPVTSMIGMSLICISTIVNGVLYLKCKNVDSQRGSKGELKSSDQLQSE